MSGASLNTARSLLKAGNFEGARRIVRKALEENSNSVVVWNLRIEIEMEAGNFKEALSLARQVLVDMPDNVAIREAEFFALARLRKKREGKKVLERFQQDFPHQTHRIGSMKMLLDSLSEQTKKVSEKLHEYGQYALGSKSQKDLGIAHHRIDDIWTAQRMMLEAHADFPDDAELNAALASNSFQLAKPATARKYARMALAANPADRRMALLIKATWAQYWPPFFIFTIIFMLHHAVAILVGKIPSIIALVALLLTTGAARDIWYDGLSVTTGFDLKWVQIGLFVGWMALYFLCLNPAIYNKLFGNKKPVRLKKY